MTVRLVVAALAVVGFGLTATNGVLAYRNAKARLLRAGKRMEKLQASRKGDGSPTPLAVEDSAVDESVQHVLHALQSSRTSLLLAGLGLLMSTTATVWGLFLPE